MSEDLIQKNDRSIEAMATRFDEMAARMRKNTGEKFGGALVIVPPPEGGDPIETLFLDNKEDVGQFWSTVKTKAEMELNRLNDLQRQQQAFRPR